MCWIIWAGDLKLKLKFEPVPHSSHARLPGLWLVLLCNQWQRNGEGARGVSDLNSLNYSARNGKNISAIRSPLEQSSLDWKKEKKSRAKGCQFVGSSGAMQAINANEAH